VSAPAHSDRRIWGRRCMCQWASYTTNSGRRSAVDGEVRRDSASAFLNTLPPLRRSMIIVARRLAVAFASTQSIRSVWVQFRAPNGDVLNSIRDICKPPQTAQTEISSRPSDVTVHRPTGRRYISSPKIRHELNREKARVRTENLKLRLHRTPIVWKATAAVIGKN